MRPAPEEFWKLVQSRQDARSQGLVTLLEAVERLCPDEGKVTHTSPSAMDKALNIKVVYKVGESSQDAELFGHERALHIAEGDRDSAPIGREAESMSLSPEHIDDQSSTTSQLLREILREQKSLKHWGINE